MGPIYKYGLENNKQSKKNSTFTFKMDDMESESNNTIPESTIGENIIDEAASEAKAVKSVREGKLERKENFKEAKKEVKDKRDDSLSELNKYQKNTAEGISRIKKARSTKRREMQDVRDKERGARNADRRNRGIERMANRNNMTTEDAAKAYDTRMSTYQAYNVNRSNAEDSKTLNNKENKNTDNVYKGLLGVGGKTYADGTFSNLGNFDELSSD
jgi:hypothetical protein